ncbi:MAG: hypothetical protein R3E93_00260 [Thiothrix sp.]
MNDIMGLLGSLNPTTTIDIDNRPAWEFIVDTLNAEDDITILSLGGFTNLAKALERDSSAISKIKWSMPWPAVYVDGNIALLNNANLSGIRGLSTVQIMLRSGMSLSTQKRQAKSLTLLYH